MAFQTPRSIEEMMTAIHKREYLMPAIQREFVWGTGQIVRLFDSLMRGYPVGSFLLWDVEARDRAVVHLLRVPHPLPRAGQPLRRQGDGARRCRQQPPCWTDSSG